MDNNQEQLLLVLALIGAGVVGNNPPPASIVSMVINILGKENLAAALKMQSDRAQLPPRLMQMLGVIE